MKRLILLSVVVLFFGCFPVSADNENSPFKDTAIIEVKSASTVGAGVSPSVSPVVVPESGEPGNEAQAPSDSLTPEQGTVKVSTSLNVRSTPWGKIIGSLHAGDKVEIIGHEGDWYKVSYNGGTAFVHSSYISTASKPAGQTAVKTSSASVKSTTASTSSVKNNAATPPGSGRFGASPCSPMPSRASSEYGRRYLLLGTFHYGIDLPVPTGTPVNALGDGVVSEVGFESGGGNFVKIRYDNGLESFYCHLQSSSVKAGQRVNMGQNVASSDNTGQETTGAHLHMGIKRNGQYIDPRSVADLPLPPK
ncbi:MAG: peptidoglycan DD-metalloendopeptidase family protein [Candidatus Riflebacteria bacterium]|nr:peptidoglycan DD-metalloendopeptidase family protein [Candidatus Riflebacteria bacterium]